MKTANDNENPAAPAPDARSRQDMTGTPLTTDQRRQTIRRLHAEGCSCVIFNRNEERVFRERGVLDLYRLLVGEPEFLAGAFVADKVVGKAAAALMILGGVGELYADVASRPALDLLRSAGIPVRCTLEVPRIVNRAKSGWCPLETRCCGLATAEACLAEIESFLQAAARDRSLCQSAPDEGPAPDADRRQEDKNAD